MRAEHVVVHAALEARVEEPLHVLGVVPRVAGFHARRRQTRGDDDDVGLRSVGRMVRQRQEADIVGSLLPVDRLVAPLTIEIDLVPDLDRVDGADCRAGP